MLLANVAVTPPPETIRSTAAKVVARPYFKLGSRPDREGEPFVLDVLRAILKPFEWLFDSLDGLPDVLRWLIVILAVVICALLIAHLAYVLLGAIGGGPARKGRADSPVARDRPPEDLEFEAQRVGAEGDYIGAIRLLLRAALRRLEIFEKKKFRPGLTNRDVLRRYRSTQLHESLQRLVETIDVKWYGNQPCQVDDYAQCQTAHARIRDYAKQSGLAVRT